MYGARGILVEVRHSGGYRVAVDTTAGRIVALRLLDPDSPTGHGATGHGATGHGGAGSVGGGRVLVRYGYDVRGRLINVVNSSGSPLRFDYDGAGRIVSWVDRNGFRYEYSYDADGRCVRTSNPDGYLNAEFRYDRRRLVTTVIDSLGHQQEFRLNPALQVIRSVDAVGGVTVSAWDRYDRLLERTDPIGRTTRYAYDDDGNLVLVGYPDQAEATAVYNGFRQPVASLAGRPNDTSAAPSSPPPGIPTRA